MKELQDKLKLRFVGSGSDSDGIRVGFKLPSGTKTEYIFPKKAVVKVSYCC